MPDSDERDSTPTDWLKQHRNGDPDGARFLFEHFSRRLCQLAQRHLSTQVRQRADGEDVVQSVFRTFFARDSREEFQIEQSDELWRLLVVITLRKARAISRTNSAEKRSVKRQVCLDDTDILQLSALSREPSVVEAIVLSDEIETLLKGMSTSHIRALELRMGGYSQSDAAAMMGLSRQSFHRLFEPLKQRLRKRLETLNGLALGFTELAEGGNK